MSHKEEGGRVIKVVPLAVDTGEAELAGGKAKRTASLWRS